MFAQGSRGRIIICGVVIHRLIFVGARISEYYHGELHDISRFFLPASFSFFFLANLSYASIVHMHNTILSTAR